jgi:hypothetical protein
MQDRRHQEISPLRRRSLDFAKHPNLSWIGDYCEITIAELLVTAQNFEGSSGTENGNLYRTFTVTRFPGLLQEEDGEQTVPDGKADHVVVTFIAAGLMPG